MSRHDAPMSGSDRDALFRRTMQRAGELRDAERRHHRIVRTVPAVLVVLALTAGVAAIVATAGSSPGHHGINPAGTSPSTAPPSSVPKQQQNSTTTEIATSGVVTGFDPLSFTAVSLSDWWVLGSASCSAGRCPVVLRTTDGGTTFEKLPAPSGISYTVSGGNTSPGIRFADKVNGWAFDSHLWETTDGGSSWTLQQTPGPVTDVEAAGGKVYALVCKQSNCSTMELLESSVGTGTWQVAALPQALVSGASLSVQATTVVVTNGPASSTGGQPVDLLVSTDSGASFSVTTSGCTPGLGGRAYLAISGSGTLWAACPTGMLATPYVSTDLGASWSAAAGHTEFSNGLALAPVSSTTALAWPSGTAGTLMRTTDGGQSYSAVLKRPSSYAVYWAGYSDPTRAYAILSNDSAPHSGQLLESEDGGVTWTAVSFSAG